jgi:nucleoside phosphorylase
MMADLSRILVVAATQRELAGAAGWRTLCCGVGPVEAAAATAAAIGAGRPAAIVHVGIAGTRRHRALAPATLVIGTEARYHDLRVPLWLAPSVVAADPVLLEAIGRALPAAQRLAIGTSGRIGGTSDTDVEAMEGFGVLRAAQHAGVPAIEVRAISNEIEEQDRTRWHFEAAFAAITAVTARLVEEAARCVN